MSTAEEELERMLGLESASARRLKDNTASAIDKIKGSPGLDSAIYTLRQTVATTVVGFRNDVRVDAAKQFSEEVGVATEPSGMNDSERGDKASAYYVKSWVNALASDYGGGGGSFGGGGSTDSWDVAVDAAHEASVGALDRIATYEVVDAWNDEHRRNADAHPELQFRRRWYTKKDVYVCKKCGPMHGVYADAGGQFSLNGAPIRWPPLHGDCRCIVITRLVTPDSEPKGGGYMDPNYEGLAHDSVQGQLITRANAMCVRGIDQQRRSVEFVASTDAVDSHGDVIEQASWQLGHYRENPVVLYGHDSRELPIGQATRVEVKNGQLETTIQFASAEANPRAEQVWQLVREGVLRAVSVGFLPTKGAYERRDGSEVFVWKSPVLKEISVVPVPANHEALARMKSAFATREKPMTTQPKNSPVQPGPKSGSAEEINTMSEGNKDLQDKVEKQAATIAKFEVEAKGLTERAEKAEAKLADVSAALKALETEKSALEAQTKALADERDAQKKRADALEATTIDQEVEALVGKKISAAEKPLFVDLRKANPDLFTKMIEQRQPMRLSESVVPPEKADAGNDADLLNELKSAGL